MTPKFELRIDPLADDPFEGMSFRTAQPSVKDQNRAVHRVLDHEADPLGLDQIWSEYSDKREWIEDSAVVLIHEQECSACSARHQFSMGWFTGKRHARDKTARQLVAGKPIGYFPVIVERVTCPPVLVCASCAEGQAFIENCAGRIEDSEGPFVMDENPGPNWPKKDSE